MKKSLKAARPAGKKKTELVLEEKARKLLLKKTFTREQLANTLDISPARVIEIIKNLVKHGLSVAVQEGENEAHLMIDKNAIASRGVSIDAKKMYGESVRFDFGAIADTHLGSKFSRLDVLNAIYDNFSASGIKHVFHGGNYVDGEKHDKFGLLVHGMQAQVAYFVKHYPMRDGITTYYVSGDDHEGWWQQADGIDIGRFVESEAHRAGRYDLVNLGYMEADIAIRIPSGKSIKIRVSHPGGGSSYAISYVAQKLVESLEGGEKPHVLLAGHFHKSMYMFYRNIHVLLLGTTKAQDVFMRKLRLAAHIGAWKCSMLISKDGTIVEFTSTWIPFLNKGYYEKLILDQADGSSENYGANDTFNVQV